MTHLLSYECFHCSEENSFLIFIVILTRLTKILELTSLYFDLEKMMKIGVSLMVMIQ